MFSNLSLAVIALFSAAVVLYGLTVGFAPEVNGKVRYVPAQSSR